VKKKIEKVIKNTNNKTVGGLFSDRQDTKNRIETIMKLDFL